MTITLTKDFASVKFTWNDDLTECSHVALGVEDADFNAILAAKGHEGADVEGWEVTID